MPGFTINFNEIQFLIILTASVTLYTSKVFYVKDIGHACVNSTLHDVTGYTYLQLQEERAPYHADLFLNVWPCGASFTELKAGDFFKVIGREFFSTNHKWSAKSL